MPLSVVTSSIISLDILFLQMMITGTIYIQVDSVVQNQGKTMLPNMLALSQNETIEKALLNFSTPSVSYRLRAQG